VRFSDTRGAKQEKWRDLRRLARQLGGDKLAANNFNYLREVRAKRAEAIYLIQLVRRRDAPSHAPRTELRVQALEDAILIPVGDLRHARIQLVQLAIGVDLMHFCAVALIDERRFCSQRIL